MNSLSLGPISGNSMTSSCTESISQSQSLDGYEYEFDPPVEARYECPICLLVLREPCQTKCGHRFCKNCILRALSRSCTRCPIDNEPLTDADIYPDNFAKREIFNCTIKCPNKSNGCEKIIPLGKLNVHLHDCDYALIPCPNKCSSILLQRDMKEHVSRQCDLRIIMCTCCGANIQAQDAQEHTNVCPKVPVKCEQCGVDLTRDVVNQHVQTTCENAQVLCPLHNLGCMSTMKRCDENSHLMEDAPNHLRQLCSAVLHVLSHLNNHSQRRSLDPTNHSTEWQQPMQDSGAFLTHYSSHFASTLNVHNSGELHQRSRPANGASVEETTILKGTSGISNPEGGNPPKQEHSLPNVSGSHVSKNQAEAGVPPLNSQQPNFRSDGQPLLASNTGDQSNLPIGSNIEPEVVALAGIHLSSPSPHVQPDVATRNQQDALQGESPAQKLLQTHSPPHANDPSQGSAMDTANTIPIILSMLEQVSISFSEYENKLETQKKEIAELKSIVSNLERQNGDLFSNILSKFYNGSYVWKIHTFSLHKERAKRGEIVTLHSQPFYTNWLGYKMCLRANITSPQYAPDGTTQQHLSLFVHIMQGDNDAALPWPFTGKIILAILDQDRDSMQLKHVVETLEAKPHLAAFQRPTTLRNQKGFGFIEFVSVAALEEGFYLVEDCLVIQARVLPNVQ